MLGRGDPRACAAPAAAKAPAAGSPVKTSTSNRVCTDHTTCTFPAAPHTAGQYISTEGTRSSDRVCSALTNCDYSAQFESTLATASTSSEEFMGSVFHCFCDDSGSNEVASWI